MKRIAPILSGILLFTTCHGLPAAEPGEEGFRPLFNGQDLSGWRLRNLQGTPSDIDQAIADANLSLAQAQLTLAEDEYQDVVDGPDPDAIQAAEARLNAAEAGLVAAEATLADSELTAPFSGTLVRMDLKQGEQAIPGKLAAVLADLSGWVVETDDLNEMEVPGIYEGQSATMVPDALQELELDGHVG